MTTLVTCKNKKEARETGKKGGLANRQLRLVTIFVQIVITIHNDISFDAIYYIDLINDLSISAYLLIYPIKLLRCPTWQGSTALMQMI